MMAFGKRGIMMANYDTIIFDLDGTLLDTLEDLTDAVNHALGELHMPHRTIDEVRRFVGNGVAKLVERALPDGASPEKAAQALAIFKDHYELHKEDKTAPYPGVVELLTTLRERGYKLAVVSNKFDQAVKDLMPRYFPGLIHAAAGEDEDRGVPKKPDPAMVRRVMAELGARRAVYVGDSEVDMQTAGNSGLPCISVTWGFRDRTFLLENGALTLADTPEEILDLV